jgi:HlyD family secretion protein
MRPRRALAWLALLAAVGIGIAVWQLQGAQAQAEASVPTAAAIRGDLVVSVGGVGRVVDAGSSVQLVLPGGSSGSGTSAPADSVTPRTSGRVTKILVAPGQEVSAGQALAQLEDGGLAAAGVKQAESDLASAHLELRQKQTSDPLKGVPATAAEIKAGQLAVDAARAKLARLLAPARSADVNAARLELKRAEADLETALGGTPATRSEAATIARYNVRIAKKRLGRILAPPNRADVSAAEAELAKAQAELALLKKAPAPPKGEVITAAEQAVDVARKKLAKLTGPADPVAVSAAQAEVKKAEADLAVLMRRPDPPVTQQEVDAAKAALDTARLRLARLLGPPDEADVAAAMLELNKALADLATLLQLSPDPLPEQLAAAKAAVESARLKLARLLEPANPADVDTARLELARARAELRKAEAGPSSAARAAAREAVNAARAKLVQLQGPTLTADVSVARVEVGKAEADLEVLRTRGGPGSAIDIELAQKKVQSAEARLASARFAEQELTVRAPIAGTVKTLLTVRGAPVDPSTPIATVADLGHLEVSVDLSEFDVAQVKRGMRAVVSVDALGGEAVPGKVRFVALSGSDTSGVVTFPVRVGLEEAEGIKPGMNVSVQIIVAKRKNVVQVPLEAVSGEDEDASVTVLNEAGEPTPRKVTLGLANNKNVEIVKGLRAGERVVIEEAGPASEE